MSELHEIGGIVFGGEKYTVGEADVVPEGLIDPLAIEWVGDGGSSGGDLSGILPVGIPVKFPDIDSGGNYITSISSSNFEDTAKTLTGVILPSHLEEVPNSLFRDGQLEFVEFGDHLTSIGGNAFRNNQLTSVDLPDSLTSIGSSAFYVNQLTSVDLPDSLESIGDWAFDSNQLTSLVLPDSLTSIGNYVFRNNQLTSVDLPDSLTSIGNSAFQNNQLTSVYIPSSVETIGNFAFALNPLKEASIGPNTTYERTSFISSTVITVRDE